MTLPDDDVKPRPGGLISEQGTPQSINELRREHDVRPTPARSADEVEEQRPGSRDRDPDR